MTGKPDAKLLHKIRKGAGIMYDNNYPNNDKVSQDNSAEQKQDVTVHSQSLHNQSAQNQSGTSQDRKSTL